MQLKSRLKPGVVQVIAAVVALLLGVMIYLSSRDPQQVYFLRYIPFLQQGESHGPSLISDFFPSLLHTYAFILLTVAVLAASLAQTRIICLFWVFIECLFEAGQHETVANQISGQLKVWLADIPLLQYAQEYFVNGTFDVLDMIAITLGAGSAYITVMLSYSLFNNFKKA